MYFTSLIFKIMVSNQKVWRHMRWDTKKFTKGDRVEWKSHGQNVKGTVEEKITDDTTTAGRKVRASKEHPQYRVKSSKTGADAAHKPDALRPDNQ